MLGSEASDPLILPAASLEIESSDDRAVVTEFPGTRGALVDHLTGGHPPRQLLARQDVVVLPGLVAPGVSVRLHVSAFRALLAGAVVERWTLVPGSMGQVDKPIDPARRRRPSGSRLLKGSSRSRSSGSPIQACASMTRLRIPAL